MTKRERMELYISWLEAQSEIYLRIGRPNLAQLYRQRIEEFQKEIEHLKQDDNGQIRSNAQDID